MTQHPVIVKQFALGLQHGHWIIVAESNGGFNLPVNDNEGILLFDRRADAARECAKMNRELQIERGN